MIPQSQQHQKSRHNLVTQLKRNRHIIKKLEVRMTEGAKNWFSWWFFVGHLSFLYVFIFLLPFYLRKYFTIWQEGRERASVLEGEILVKRVIKIYRKKYGVVFYFEFFVFLFSLRKVVFMQFIIEFVLLQGFRG